MHIKGRQIFQERKGWRVLDILSTSKGNAKVKETYTKKNPIEKPFTRQAGLKHLNKKVNQGT